MREQSNVNNGRLLRISQDEAKKNEISYSWKRIRKNNSAYTWNVESLADLDGCCECFFGRILD